MTVPRLFLPLALSCWTLAAAAPALVPHPTQDEDPAAGQATPQAQQEAEIAPQPGVGTDDPRFSGPCTLGADGKGSCARCAAGSRFGSPLVVGGRHVSDLEIMRYVVYGPGRSSLELRRLEVLMERERDERVARGEDMSAFTPTEEEYQRAEQHEIDHFLERYPNLDLDTEIARAYRSVDMYKRMKRQTVEFDKMFFPGQPIDWPDITKEAINQGVMIGQPDGTDFIDLIADAQQGWEQRKAYAEESGEEMEPEDELYMGLLRDYVIAVLGELCPTESDATLLPEEVLMRIESNGQTFDIPTEDVFAEVAKYVWPKEIEDTKLFLALVTAAGLDLAAGGWAIPAEEFSTEMDTVAQEMETAMFNFDFLALEGFQFPSVQAYRRHLWQLRAFEKSIADTLAPGPDGSLAPALSDHLKRANNIMGLGKLDAEILLVSAFDWPDYEWKPDGWSWAQKESERLKAEIDAHLDAIEAYDAAKREAVSKGENVDPNLVQPLPFERFWAEKLDLHSEFWDPPMPATGKTPPMEGLKLKGRFGTETRNDLYRDIGESPFTAYLANGSVTDQIFFDMSPGTVAGPFLGPHGYYIVYLKHRSAPTNPLRPNEPRHVELLRDDYVRYHFTKFSHDRLQAAQVRGL